MINLFGLKKENEGIKNRKITGIRNLFEHEEEENYFKPGRVIVILKIKVSVSWIKS